MADVNALTHWRARGIREFHHTDATRVELDEETRKLIADLRARIEALETIPTAQIELSGALRAVLLLMQDMDDRAKALEDEARSTRATLEDTLPVLRAVVAGQRG